MLEQMQGIRAVNSSGQGPSTVTQPLPPPSSFPSLGLSPFMGSTSTTSSNSQSKYSEAIIKKIMSNGFTRDQAIKELDECKGDVDKAIVQLLARTLHL